MLLIVDVDCWCEVNCYVSQDSDTLCSHSLVAGGGVGIHRRDPAKHDFDYGAEYRAKVSHCKSYTRSVASSHGRPAPFSFFVQLKTAWERGSLIPRPTRLGNEATRLVYLATLCLAIVLKVEETSG